MRDLSINLHLPLPLSRLSGWPVAGAVASALGKKLECWLAARRFTRWTIAARITRDRAYAGSTAQRGIFAVVWYLADDFSEAQRTSLLYTARSIARAADAELASMWRWLRYCPARQHLPDEDIGAFDVEARRAFASIEDAIVLVADTEGRELMNTASQPARYVPYRYRRNRSAETSLRNRARLALRTSSSVPSLTTGS